MSAAELSRSFAAALTPSGRGAVAVIGIRGPLADVALAQHFQRDTSQAKIQGCLGSERSEAPSSTRWGLTSFDPSHAESNLPPLRRILYGTWQPRDNPTGPREDVVLTRFETHWELGCHGGAIAAPAILRDLMAAGIESVSWHEWLTLTSKNRLQASASIALAAAQSPAAALALLRAKELTEKRLQELCELIASHASEMRAKPQAWPTALLETARWAKRLTTPWNIVLAGLPNAGKSSLLNALVGYERAIVFAQPGTTRDVVTAAAAHEGWRWELRDTAGLRATDDALEAAGIERTNATLAASDVTVLVIDGTRPWNESAELRRAHPTAIVVRNKSDLWEGKTIWEGEARAESFEARASSPSKLASDLGQDAQVTTAPLAISTLTGRGLEELRAEIHAQLKLPAWNEIGACVWDAALEHDLRTLQHVLRDDPAALPAVISELRTWTE